MSDNPRKKKLDGKRIALSQPHERRYWCRALGVTIERLRAAVKEVGTSVLIVRRELQFDAWATGNKFDDCGDRLDDWPKSA